MRWPARGLRLAYSGDVTHPTIANQITLADGLSREFLLHHHCCPLSLEPDGTVIVAVAPDSPPAALDDIAVSYGRQAVAHATQADEVVRLIERLVTRTDRAIELESGDAIDPAHEAADIRDLVITGLILDRING